MDAVGSLMYFIAMLGKKDIWFRRFLRLIFDFILLC